jgi:hypothetical protein
MNPDPIPDRPPLPTSPAPLNIDMVSAGAAALRAWSKEDEPEELIVVEIYLRMRAAEYSLTIPTLP